MGIKTRFNPMGGGENENFDAWLYTTRVDANGRNIKTLYFYNNSIGGDVVKVPRKKTELQDYQGGTNATYDTLPFYNHQTLTSVDLRNVPFANNDMRYAFKGCSNLTYAGGLNKNVTNMSSTFNGCYNLNQNIQIPSSVTNMWCTFYNCQNLNQNIQIPNSVTNMAGTFWGCQNLNQNIQIPNSVTSMYETFSNCTNFNQNIQIPNSVTSMYETFSTCTNFNQNIQIPNSVTDMRSTFYNCQNLNQNIQIPSSVTNMWYTFYGCYNLGSLGQRCIDIYSPRVASATGAFSSTSYYNTSNQLTVVFPKLWINGVVTTTANSLTSSGYKYGTGLGITSVAANMNLKMWDRIPYQGYTTYSADTTNSHWALGLWNKAGASTDIEHPLTLAPYGIPYITRANISTYAHNTSITSIKISESTPWVADRTGWYKNAKSRDGAFNHCTNLTRADVWINDSVRGMNLTFWYCSNLQYANIHIPNNGTSLHGFFAECVNLYSVNTGTSFKPRTFDLDIPDTVTNAGSLLSGCKELSNIHLKGNSITVLGTCFDRCNTRDMDIYIDSPVVASIVNIHRGYNVAFTKNYYIPYMYANGTYTTTYTTFNAQAVFRNNATSNFYIYDKSPYNSVADYVVTVTSPNMMLTTYRGQSHTPTAVNTIPFSSDVASEVYLTKSTYTLNGTLTSINCNNVPFATANYAFRNCFNVKEIDNMVIDDTVINCQSVFENCRSITEVPMSPSSSTVTQAAYMYKGCTNLGLDGAQAIVFGSNAINFRQTFNGCSNLQGDIYFLSPSSSTSANKWNGTFTGKNTSRRLNLYCYYKWSNGTYTSTYNILKAAVYSGTSGVSASPMYNSTSNYWVFDITTDGGPSNNANFAVGSSGRVRWIGSRNPQSEIIIPNTLSYKPYPDSTTTTSVSVTNIYNTFSGCTNLNQDIQIPSSVTGMSGTFQGCTNLNQNIQIPSSVTDMYSTFDFCYNLNQNIQIPNSVINMVNTFSHCTIFNQNIQIPSNVTDMHFTFGGCYNLNQNIQIPNSVTNMAGTFWLCYNLNQNIQIPNSVVDMASAFYSCQNLNQNIQISSSVTSMYRTFWYCENLTGRINILSTEITNTTSCFFGTTLQKDVYIPYTYENGEYTKTYNSFQRAGYLGETPQDGVTMHDLNEIQGA